MPATARFFSIYEGTNAIQSLDLQMRKILMNRDHYNYSILKKRIAETVKAAKGRVDDKYITLVVRGMEKLDEVINMMKTQMQEGKFLALVLNANAAAAGHVPACPRVAASVEPDNNHAQEDGHPW